METREKIIEVAAPLFFYKGVKAVTMDTIAKECGMSKRTLYENFRDKEELLVQVLVEMAARHRRAALSSLGGTENVIEAIFTFVLACHGDAFEQRHRFFDELKAVYPDVYERIMSMGLTSNDEISYRILKRGVNEGIFVRDVDVETCNKAMRYAGEILASSHSDGQEADAAFGKIISSVLIPYIRGLCTPKGLAVLEEVLSKNKGQLASAMGMAAGRADNDENEEQKSIKTKCK